VESSRWKLGALCAAARLGLSSDVLLCNLPCASACRPPHRVQPALATAAASLPSAAASPAAPPIPSTPAAPAPPPLALPAAAPPPAAQPAAPAHAAAPAQPAAIPAHKAAAAAAPAAAGPARQLQSGSSGCFLHPPVH
jgi:hypothetical protein